MERKFRITIARLLEHASIILKALTKDLPDFNEFDADLNEELVTKIQTQYDESLTEGGDDVARGVLGQKTQTLQNVTKDCNEMVKELRYWVKKAYKNDPASMRRFQLSKYWGIRNRQAELITYMNGLATVVTSLRPGLEAVNTPATLLDNVKTLADLLQQANSDQENEKGNRNTATQDRITRLNDLYENCIKFSDAAEFIYSDTAGKRELYRIPGNSSPSTEDEEASENVDSSTAS